MARASASRALDGWLPREFGGYRNLDDTLHVSQTHSKHWRISAYNVERDTWVRQASIHTSAEAAQLAAQSTEPVLWPPSRV